MKSKLNLPADRVAYARQLAERITAPVQDFIDGHSSVTVERATLRLAGADGASPDGVPVANLVVDRIRAADPAALEDGATLRYVNALLKTGGNERALNDRIAAGFDVTSLPLGDRAAIEAKADEIVAGTLARIKRNREFREGKLEQWKGRNNSPLLYLIVATGNIYEDVKQAAAAAEQGADVIAVIRTTAQSLLDYVPYGATTEGFGGTYATQENFRIMRAALDEVAEKQQQIGRAHV